MTSEFSLSNTSVICRIYGRRHWGPVGRGTRWAFEGPQRSLCFESGLSESQELRSRCGGPAKRAHKLRFLSLRLRAIDPDQSTEEAIGGLALLGNPGLLLLIYAWPPKAHVSSRWRLVRPGGTAHGEQAAQPGLTFGKAAIQSAGLRRGFAHSILSLAFAACLVCHCMLLGSSAPPRFSGTM